MSTDREPLFLIGMNDRTPEELADVVAQLLQQSGVEVIDDEHRADEPPSD